MSEIAELPKTPNFDLPSRKIIVSENFGLVNDIYEIAVRGETLTSYNDLPAATVKGKNGATLTITPARIHSNTQGSVWYDIDIEDKDGGGIKYHLQNEEDYLALLCGWEGVPDITGGKKSAGIQSRILLGTNIPERLRLEDELTDFLATVKKDQPEPKVIQLPTSLIQNPEEDLPAVNYKSRGSRD